MVFGVLRQFGHHPGYGARRHEVLAPELLGGQVGELRNAVSSFIGGLPRGVLSMCGIEVVNEDLVTVRVFFAGGIVLAVSPLKLREELRVGRGRSGEESNRHEGEEECLLHLLTVCLLLFVRLYDEKESLTLLK